MPLTRRVVIFDNIVLGLRDFRSSLEYDCVFSHVEKKLWKNRIYMHKSTVFNICNRILSIIVKWARRSCIIFYC